MLHMCKALGVILNEVGEELERRSTKPTGKPKTPATFERREVRVKPIMVYRKVRRLR